MGDVDSHLLDQTRPEDALPPNDLPTDTDNAKFLEAATESHAGYRKHQFDIPSDQEQTRMANVNSLQKPSLPPPSRTPGQAPQPRNAPPRQQQDERTRAVDIRNDLGINDPSINDIDWDID
jgi:hypothetical protein